MFRKAPDRSMVKARFKAVLRMSIELHLSDCAKKLPDEMQREMMTPRSRRPVTMALQPPEEALKDSDGFKVGAFERCTNHYNLVLPPSLFANLINFLARPIIPTLGSRLRIARPLNLIGLGHVW